MFSFWCWPAVDRLRAPGLWLQGLGGPGAKTGALICGDAPWALCRQCAQSLSCVRLFVTPWTVGQTAAHQTPLSMEIIQARMLEWVAMPSSRGSSQPRDQTQVSHISGRFFTIQDTRKALQAGWSLILSCGLRVFYISRAAGQWGCIST